MTRHMEPGILRFQTCLSEQVEQQIVLNRHMVCTNSIIDGLVSQLFHQMKRKRKAVQCTLVPPQATVHFGHSPCFPTWQFSLNWRQSTVQNSFQISDIWTITHEWHYECQIFAVLNDQHWLALMLILSLKSASDCAL